MKSPLIGYVPQPVDMTAIYKKHPPVERVEENNDHRFEARAELVQQLPQNAVGAEVGVFTGVFAEYLAAHAKPAKFYLVDAWGCNTKAKRWEVPKGRENVAKYVDGGNLTYAGARNAAKHRASHIGKTEVVSALSVPWLWSVEEKSLDWVYLDTTHHYDHTLNELRAMDRAVKDDGLLTGDDAWEDCPDPLFGVVRAIETFTAETDWKLVYLKNGQFILRK